MCLLALGMAALEQGDCERATTLFEETLHVLRELRDKVGTSYCLLGVAGVASSQGRPVRAARLWGAAEALREASGLHLLSAFQRSHYDYEGHLAAARSLLDEAAWTAAWAEGRAMTPEQAVEYALGTWEPASPAAPEPEEKKRASAGGAPGNPLTRRQQEVTLLVARGLTNRQVAAELMLSEHTVVTHVREILKKLGFHSRTQLAAWVMEQEPLP
jgi:non-specific serine/threonine protein kinase